MRRTGIYSDLFMAQQFREEVASVILTGDWDALAEVASAWLQFEQDAVARLILIAGHLFKGRYREAYEEHAGMFQEPENPDTALENPRPAIKEFAESLVKAHPENA